MTTDPKDDLHRYLQLAREALLWKLEGLSEYDLRRPMVPTGTNLLGLVKHVASVEAGYLGDTFDRPFPESFPWFADDAEPNADLWATPDESREDIVDLYRRVWAHSDATIKDLPLDTLGVVPWWPQVRAEVSLHRVLIHMIAETDRHAGHADIVRELIDGSVGLREGNDNMAEGDRDWWSGYRDRLEQAARVATAVPGLVIDPGLLEAWHRIGAPEPIGLAGALAGGCGAVVAVLAGPDDERWGEIAAPAMAAALGVSSVEVLAVPGSSLAALLREWIYQAAQGSGRGVHLKIDPEGGTPDPDGRPGIRLLVHAIDSSARELAMRLASPQDPALPALRAVLGRPVDVIDAEDLVQGHGTTT